MMIVMMIFNLVTEWWENKKRMQEYEAKKAQGMNVKPPKPRRMFA